MFPTRSGASPRWRRWCSPPAPRSPAEELVAWTNQRVGAKYQRIREVVFYDEFPRNVAGKTLKRQMRAEYSAG